MQVLRETLDRHSYGLLEKLPNAINYQPGLPSLLSFEGNFYCQATCLSCHYPRCMWFSGEDIVCTTIPSFPGDQSTEVCPVKAISWDDQLEIPVIDPKSCINCGLCISRCPVGAIYYSEGIVVNQVNNKMFTKVNANSSMRTSQERLIQSLLGIKRRGVFLLESDQLMRKVYSILERTKSCDQNTVIRNLLIGLGCSCAMRRIGDVYTRMDAIYTSLKGTFGAIEVEFGRDTLSASRGILDDIAVLNTRYFISKNQNHTLVVCLHLPNARQGYWQVIRDIKNVENIRINTLSVGALLLLLWNSKIFEPDNISYYVDYDNMSIRKIIEGQLGRQINISEKYLGILEPMK